MREDKARKKDGERNVERGRQRVTERERERERELAKLHRAKREKNIYLREKQVREKHI